MDEREARVVADEVIAPDLGGVDMVVLAEPAGDVDHVRGHIEVEGRAAGQVRPLGQGSRWLTDSPVSISTTVCRR